MRRRFTPAQANATLPLVRRVVEDILLRGRELRALGRAEGEPDPAAQARIGVLEAELHELFAELERIGCSYRDWGFDLGLVDFPGVIGGREVLLCWRSDEPAVSWYHPPDAGFAGRRPIPPELLEGQGGA